MLRNLVCLGGNSRVWEVGRVWCHESMTQKLQEEGHCVPKCQEGDFSQLQPDGAQSIANKTSKVDRIRCQ